MVPLERVVKEVDEEGNDSECEPDYRPHDVELLGLHELSRSRGLAGHDIAHLDVTVDLGPEDCLGVARRRRRVHGRSLGPASSRPAFLPTMLGRTGTRQRGRAGALITRANSGK